MATAVTGALPEPHLAPTRAPSLAGRAVLAAALFVGFYVFALAIAALLLAVVWFCFAKLERAPAMIVIPCALGALGILWSLVPRYPRFQPPGPELFDAEQPRLFERLRVGNNGVGLKVRDHVIHGRLLIHWIVNGLPDRPRRGPRGSGIAVRRPQAAACARGARP